MRSFGLRIVMRLLLPLAILTLVLPAAAALDLGAPQEGPDVPTASAPVATITVLDHEVYQFTAQYRGHNVTAPERPWNRVVLTWEQQPLGDPWDRTFSASIGGVEVLRGTTPRSHFTITRDVTRYASMLRDDEPVMVEGYADSWVGGGQQVTLTLSFYNDPSAAAVAPPAAHVFGVDRMASLAIGSAAAPVTLDLGHRVPERASVEFFLSGHGDQEDWFLFPESPPTFHVLVDGHVIGTAVAMPYTYAFVGFCDGDGCTATPQDDQVHGAMWWTAQQGADAAGVHTGVGEIPPYVVNVDKADLPLLTGERSVQLVLDPDAANDVTGANGSSVWLSSASILTG